MTVSAATVPAAEAPNGFSIPASAMGIVLGMAGLSNCWRVAHTLCGVGTDISDILFAVTTLIWAVLVLAFAAKWLTHRDEALAEARHPVACCFIGLIPVATLLVAAWVGIARTASAARFQGLARLALTATALFSYNAFICLTIAAISALDGNRYIANQFVFSLFGFFSGALLLGAMAAVLYRNRKGPSDPGPAPGDPDPRAARPAQ